MLNLESLGGLISDPYFLIKVFLFCKYLLYTDNLKIFHSIFSSTSTPLI